VLLDTLLIVAAASSPFTTPPPSAIAAGRIESTQVILSCETPRELRHEATLGGIAVGENLPSPSTSLELYKRDGKVGVRQRTEEGPNAGVRTLAANYLSGDEGGYYHLEYTRNEHKAHLFFTLNADQSGQLMWSTARATIETNCRAG